MRIFKLSITRTRLAVYVVMAYVTLWSLIVFILVLVQWYVVGKWVLTSHILTYIKPANKSVLGALPASC